MDVASVLSKEDKDQSLREVIKRPKKSVPPPKYMCLPDVSRIQNSLVQHFGMIPSFGRCEWTDSTESINCENVQKASNKKAFKSLCLIKKQSKDAWMSIGENRSFWSHMLIGVNATIKRLQRQRTECHSKSTALPLSCVLLDAGWLNSILGHHIAHMCSNLGVRLLSVRPPGALVDLATSHVRSFKTVLAIGVCSSNDCPVDLRTWLSRVRETVPPLSTTSGRSMAPQIVSTTLSASLNQEEVCSSVFSATSQSQPQDGPPTASSSTATTEVNGESWDKYTIPDPSSLYLFPSDSGRSGQIHTLSELLLDLTRSAAQTRSGESGCGSIEGIEWRQSCGEQHLPAFQTTVIRAVEAQQTRRTKKRGKRKGGTKELSVGIDD